MEKQLQRLWNNRNVYHVVFLVTYLIIITVAIIFVVNRSPGEVSANGFLFCGIAFSYILVVHTLFYLKWHRTTDFMLLLFYCAFAASVVGVWGINTAIGVFVLGTIIVFTGVLLTARHAFIVALIAGFTLIGLQYATACHRFRADGIWVRGKTDFEDIIVYCLGFSGLVLVLWFYNREAQRALDRARQARMAVKLQKKALKIRSKKITEKLRRAQLEEMQQMYRFAELGQEGVVLLHDLANHLTALNLEVESLQKAQPSKDIAPTRQIIRHLGDIVNCAQSRLHGNTQKQQFDVVKKISGAIAFLQPKAAKRKVIIEWESPGRPWTYAGDPACFCQAITIVINNAIDAYDETFTTAHPRKARVVRVEVEAEDGYVGLHISDWGKGISKEGRKNLFKPVHSTKKSGLGIGLYITKQILEMQFSATIALAPRDDRTEFIIKLPLPI